MTITDAEYGVYDQAVEDAWATYYDTKRDLDARLDEATEKRAAAVRTAKARLRVAPAVKEWIDGRYGDPGKPGLFDRLSGGVYTPDESRRLHHDLFSVDDDMALVMIVEGIYEWPDWAAEELDLDGWQLVPITGYALAVYPTETTTGYWRSI